MAEKVVIGLEIDAKDGVKTLGKLEDTAEELNKELKKVPMGTKAFKDLQRQLVGVNKQIKNTELSMEALDNEQVASEIGSVAGAVGDMSAAFVLLGGEDGAAAEAAANIQKAMGISMAFKGAIEGISSARKLFNNILKNNNVLQKANIILIKLTTVVQKALGRSTVVTSKAFKGMRTAIMATGIGALIVAVGLLIANFDKILGMFKGTDTAADQLNKTLDKYSEGMGEAIIKTDKVSEAFRKLEDGTMTEEEALFVYNDTLGNTMGHYDNIEDAEKRFTSGTAGYLEAMGMRAQAQALFQKKAEVQAQLAAYEQGKTISEFMKMLHFFYAISFGWLESLLEGQVVTVGETMKKYEDEKNAAAVRDLKLQQASLDVAAKHASDEYDLLVAANNLTSEEDDAFNAEEDRKKRERERDAKKRRQERIRAEAKELKAIYNLKLAHLQKVANEIDDTEIEGARDKAKKLIEIEEFKEIELLKNKKLTATERLLIEFKTSQAIDKINKSLFEKEKELDEARIEREQAQWDLLQEIKGTQQEAEIAALVLEYEEKYALAVGNAELEKELKIQQEEDIKAIEKTYADEAAENAATLKEEADTARDEERDAKIKSIQEGFDMAKQAATAIQGLGDLVFANKMKNVKKGSKAEEQLARKQFKFNKAMQLSGAVIDAGKAIVASLAAAPLAIGILPNPIGIANLAMTAITSAINIAKIKQKTFQGGSTSAPSSIASPNFGGGGEVPNLGTVTNTSTLLPTGEDRVKVFVTETDISNTQNKVAVIEDQSTY